MKKLTLSILILLCLTGPAWGANDFSGDANCKALWRFENGALTTDSKGTNTLTATNTPVADLVNFKEGAAGVDLENTDGDYFTIQDGLLDAGFPFKSGDTNKKISVCAWFRPESLPGWFWKWGIWGKSTSLYMTLDNPDNNGGRFALNLKYVDLSWNRFQHMAVAPVAGQWYHVGYTYDDSDKSYRIRVWDATAESVSETTGTAAQNIHAPGESGEVDIGYASANYSDGVLDEIVVFNDVLTADEIDQIRGGTFGASSSVNNWWWRRRQGQHHEPLNLIPLRQFTDITPSERISA